jgi:hypothetical protein
VVAAAPKAGPHPARVPRGKAVATIDTAPARKTTPAQADGTSPVQAGKTTPAQAEGTSQREVAAETTKAARRRPDPPGEETPTAGRGPIVRPIPRCRTM